MSSPNLQNGTRAVPGPPRKIWHASEPPFEGLKEIDLGGFAKSDANSTIVIDNGQHS